MGTQLPSPKGAEPPPPIFSSFSLWPNGWMHQDATWYGGRPQLRRICVRWGSRSPLPKKGAKPQFSAHFYCSQNARCIKMPLGMEVGLSPGDFVLDGDSAPSPKRGRNPAPQFSAHFYCDHTAGCIKMPLGMEVGPGDIVLDGDPSPPKRGRDSSPPLLC